MTLSPVLFLIFNRPELTEKVFSQIRKARPRRLFIAADGPRQGVASDPKDCAATRAVTECISWDCHVQRLYRDSNLGCGRAVSCAIDWFFKYVEEGIILEDDCYPSLSFFPFCTDMLKRYRDNDRIMMVSGFNRLGTWKPEKHDYFFSGGGIWGWATWRRAWSHYDHHMRDFEDPVVRKTVQRACKKQGSSLYQAFEKTYRGEVDTWDYQWAFARLKQGGLAVTPSLNLIRNIGSGAAAATHENKKNDYLHSLEIYELDPPYYGPYRIKNDLAFAQRCWFMIQYGPHAINEIRGQIKMFVHKVFPLLGPLLLKKMNKISALTSKRIRRVWNFCVQLFARNA